MFTKLLKSDTPPHGISWHVGSGKGRMKEEWRGSLYGLCCCSLGAEVWGLVTLQQCLPVPLTAHWGCFAGDGGKAMCSLVLNWAAVVAPPTWRRLSEDADLLQGSLWLSPWLLHATGSPQTNSIQLQLHRSGFSSLHLKPDLNTTFVLVFKNRSLSSFKKKQT